MVKAEGDGPDPKEEEPILKSICGMKRALAENHVNGLCIQFGTHFFFLAHTHKDLDGHSPLNWLVHDAFHFLQVLVLHNLPQ